MLTTGIVTTVLFFFGGGGTLSILLFHSPDSNNTKPDFPVCVAVFKPTIPYSVREVWRGGETHLRQYSCIR